MDLNYSDMSNFSTSKEMKNSINEICIQKIYCYNYNINEDHQSTQIKLDINDIDNNKDNFDSIFDEIFNPSKYLTPLNFLEDKRENEEKIRTHSDSFNENKYINITYNSNVVNNNNNNFFNINNNNHINIEQQLYNIIYSLTEEKIVIIMKELYNISDNENILISYRRDALLLIKKLIRELNNRINLKLQNLEKVKN